MEGDIPKRESFIVILKNIVVNLGQPMVLKITSVDATGVGTISSSMGRWEYRKKEFFVFKKTEYNWKTLGSHMISFSSLLKLHG